jgi:hypothetical protein
MRSGMLLELCGPSTHKVTLDALERIAGIAQIPLFVLLRYIGVARRRFGRQLALILVVVVLEEVIVDVIDYMEFSVANRADEQLLIVGIGGGGCGRRSGHGSRRIVVNEGN